MPELKIDQPTPSMLAIHQRAALPRALMGDTDAMRAAGPIYLPKWKKEDAEAYAGRLKVSFLFNVYKRAAVALVGRVFRDQIKIAAELTEKFPEFDKWTADMDKARTKLQTFAREVFADAVHTGAGYVIEDYPILGDGQRTVAQQRAAGLNPYSRHLTAESVLGISKRTLDDGSEMVTRLRVSEPFLRDDGEFGEEEVKRVRIYRQPEPDLPPTFRLWERKSKTDEATAAEPTKGWEVIDDGAMGNIDRIPLAEFNPPGEGPLLGSLASMNLKHWQSSSMQAAMMAHVRLVLFLADFPKDAKGFELSAVANGTTIHIPQERKFEYLTYPSDAPSFGERDLEKLEAQMQSLALEPMMKRTGDQTATASALDQDQSDSALGGWVVAFREFLEGVFQLKAKWAGLADVDMTGKVDMSADVGLSGEASDLLRVGLEAYNANAISRDEWLQLWKTHANDALDIEEEMARLEQGDLTLGGTGQTRAAVRKALEGLELDEDEIERRIGAATTEEEEG